MHRSASSHFGTRFKVDKARQLEWLQNPAVDERDVWPVSIVTPLADVAVPGARGKQEDDQASPRSSAPLDGTRNSSPSPKGDRATVRVRACSAVDALEGKRGVRAYATVEQDRDLVLRLRHRRTEDDVLARMPLCGLELVDIGERRVVIVPRLEPSRLALDGLFLLDVEDDKIFWGIIPSQRATYRDVQGAKLQTAQARPIAQELPRRVHSRRRRLPPIPEVPRAEASVTESSAAASSSSPARVQQQQASRNIASGRDRA